MPDDLDIKCVSLSLGTLFVAIHLVVVFLALGGGLTYLQGMYFVSFSYTFVPFNILAFIAGIFVAFISGAGIGALFCIIYNHIKNKPAF